MTQIMQSSGQKTVGRFALWQLGFRPFYLLASLFSALSVLLWAAAFGLYVVRYWPVLTRPRLDGKPG